MALSKKFRNFACRNGDKFTELHVLGKVFFFGGGGICLCKLQCELATLLHYLPIYLWSEQRKKKSFSFDCGVKVCTRAASTAHSLCCGTFHPSLPAGCLCLHPKRAISERTGRELGSSIQLFSARGINKSAGFCS